MLKLVLKVQAVVGICCEERRNAEIGSNLNFIVILSVWKVILFYFCLKAACVENASAAHPVNVLASIAVSHAQL